jgi:3-isopropylmalate/(R)-2-methylmalate dehydratase small subunit
VQPFRTHSGRAVPLLARDIDTDQIIPKQFLKSLERTGFGQFLFHDWRTRPDGSSIAECVLNDPRYQGASILIAGANFGCGSSREHAAWALSDYGFRAVIAPSFADIFRGNAVTNGLLPVTLPDPVVVALGEHVVADPGCTIRIDLESRHVTDGRGVDAPFTIDDNARNRLLRGLDDIGLILQYEDDISRYEHAS